MTREEARKAAEVMMAYADGKEIESKRRIFSNDSWYEIKNGEPVFNWQNCDYRIKKEPKLKSIYRPFKDKEECWNEMQKHRPFGWVKNTGLLTCLTSIGDTTDFNYAYEVLCFADGTPFGIKEE